MRGASDPQTLLGVHGLHVPQVCPLIELFGMWYRFKELEREYEITSLRPLWFMEIK